MFFARKLNMRGGKERDKNQKREIKTTLLFRLYEWARCAIKTCHHVKSFTSQAAIFPQSLKASIQWHCAHIVLEFRLLEGLSRFTDGARAGRWVVGGLEGAWVWVACPCNIPKT